MKEIKLMNLSLKNFKGIKELAINFNGENLKAYGDNGTGKTTIPDSFMWVLFGKDTNNRTDFAIKTLDKDGKEINNLEHEVEVSFYIDGQPLLLKKIYKEKYTKKRGAPIAEFTGHETNHYIDDVPVKKKEYEAKVSSIIDEEAFKLLTSPTFFNEQLKWQDRRTEVIKVCGDIADEDVFNSNSELKKLPTILQGRAIDDHKKVIAARRAEINKELNMIPVRIDEINNSMPEEIDVPSIEAEVSKIEKELDEHETQINNINNGSAITEKQNQLRQIELDLKEIQSELESEAIEKGHVVNTRIQEEESNEAILNRKKDDKEFQVERLEKEVSDFDKTLVQLREDWNKENERVYEHDHNADSVCPTCKQDLPAEEVEAAERKAIETFNLKKSQEIERINNDGKKIAEINKKKREEIEELKKEITSLETENRSKRKMIANLTEELNTLRQAVKEARQDKRYTDKVTEKETVGREIESLQENAQQAVSDIEKEVAELRTKRTELNTQIAQQAQIRANHKRIGELEEQQKDLATEFEKLEHELYLTEQFIQSKVKLLEEKINSKFKYARFNLFKTNINGGIEEICETTYEGVPFSSGLNNAARINVGIDIINTLTEHYGIRAPIFVDNSEAVTRLAGTDSQLISLVVSEKDKKLRIEKQSDEKSDAERLIAEGMQALGKKEAI